MYSMVYKKNKSSSQSNRYANVSMVYSDCPRTLNLEVYCMGMAIRYKPLDLDYNIPIRKGLFRIALIGLGS